MKTTIKRLVRNEQERQATELGNGGPLDAARKTVARNIRHWRRVVGVAKTREILKRG